MDGREAISMSGPSTFYYIQKDTGDRPSADTSPHVLPVPIRSVPTPDSMNPARAEWNAESHPTTVQAQDVPDSNNGSGPTGTTPVKKKRGRPRKYGHGGPVGLALVPLSVSAPPALPGTSNGGSGQKKRGKLPGTGTKQQLAQLGEWLSGSSGMGFTPHALRIAVGEDISSKVMSFSQHGPRTVCILSANGAVSTVTLRQNTLSGGTITYEGCFEILSLSGSYTMVDTENGTHCRTGGLSISLCSPDGRVFGGSVSGLLIAASPIQVIVGSFIYSRAKAKVKTKGSAKAAFEFEHNTGNHYSTPQSTALSDHIASPLIWSPSRHMEIRSGHLDIDLTSG